MNMLAGFGRRSASSMQPSSQILLKDFWPHSNLCQAHGEVSAVLQQGGAFAELLGQEGLALLLNPDLLTRERSGTPAVE